MGLKLPKVKLIVFKFEPKSETHRDLSCCIFIKYTCTCKDYCIFFFDTREGGENCYANNKKKQFTEYFNLN